MTLIVRFEVTGFDPVAVSGFETADWFGALHFHKTLTEGIVGSAETVFLSSGVEGSRAYVAVERISGSAEFGSGELTVHHGGLESDPDAWWGHLVPESGTGTFLGWTGSARIRHDEQGPFFEIDLD